MERQREGVSKAKTNRSDGETLSCTEYYLFEREIPNSKSKPAGAENREHQGSPNTNRKPEPTLTV